MSFYRVARAVGTPVSFEAETRNTALQCTGETHFEVGHGRIGQPD